MKKYKVMIVITALYAIIGLAALAIYCSSDGGYPIHTQTKPEKILFYTVDNNDVIGCEMNTKYEELIAVADEVEKN